jgi:glycine oxidase
MSETVDFIIVGGGITGRLMQLELMQRGVAALVVDEPNSNQCTAVAAGLSNPLVGKFFTIGWRSDDFFSGLSTFYTKLETRLDASFYKASTMKRIIASAGEQNIWLSKAHLKKYNGFCTFSNEGVDGVNSNFGVLNVHQGGQLDTRAFLTACLAKLPTLETKFDYTQLDVKNKRYENMAYKHVVFCEGYRVMNNPFFKEWVNVIPTKGELLEIETDLEPSGDVYLGTVFLQHLKGKIWRVGSTYAQGDSSTHPTDMMKSDLIAKLEKVLTVPYTVVNHYAGVRPASPDRKPILGTHPEDKTMHLINGMGSKAVTLAPVLIKEMADYLLNDAPLHPEIALTRF